MALSTEKTFVVNLIDIVLIESEYIPCNVYKDGLYVASNIDEGDTSSSSSTGALFASASGLYIPGLMCTGTRTQPSAHYH